MICFSTISYYGSARGTFAYVILSWIVIVIWYFYLFIDESRRDNWFRQKNISVTDVLFLSMIHFLGLDLYGFQFLRKVTFKENLIVISIRGIKHC